MEHRILTERAPRDEGALLEVIRSVRRRWRWRLALRGATYVAFGGLLAFLAAAWAIDALRFTATAIVAARLTTYLVVLGLAVRYLVVPLRRRVTDEQVALYLEEHEPSLEGRVLGAVDLQGGARQAASAALLRGLVERAVDACASVEYGRRVERPRLQRFSGILAGASIAGAALLLIRPGFLGTGLPVLVNPLGATSAAVPYAVTATPGNTAVPRGADVRVEATLRHFEADRVEVALRRGVAAEWEWVPMVQDAETGAWSLLLFNVADTTEYVVEASRVRSPIYRIDVLDLPYVERIDLTYHFPAYTGLEPRREEDGGDIAALAGTRVEVTVVPTMAIAGGHLVVDERDSLPLTPGGDGTWTGTIAVRDPGLYRVILESVEGLTAVASPDYYIDVLSDLPPSIRVARPGRDLRVTSIDEVFVEVEAEDDYGLGPVELVVSVNGEAEDVVPLYAGGGRRTLTAGHTFYLEELDLQPGDLVSYFARATDRNRVTDPQRAATDIYFLDIRPFDQQFRQAESQGGQPGGAGDGDVGELSRRQRDIVAATFNLVRDSARLTADDIRERVTTLALAQGRLREEVETLVGRMQRRGVVQMDTSFAAVAEALPRAVGAMTDAEEDLGERRPQDALSPEQRALQYLQRAEAAFRERQVTQGGGGGGGGGGSSASAEELADLFDLEMDRLRNQYEEVDRGQRQQAAEEVDEVLERLRELARRQQQENERLRARAANPAAGAGGESQRRLAEEVEETARQLERLSRDRSRADLQETARRLREAAEAMRRAAASGEGSGADRGQAALERLREARELLEQRRAEGLESEVRDALRRAERLGQEQEGVTREVEALENAADRAERLRRLLDRKDQMTAEVEDLESQLNQLARDVRREAPAAADELQQAVRELRDRRVADKIRYSRGVVQGRSAEYARTFEEQIGADLDELEARVRAALDAMGASSAQQLEGTLERARELARALESLEDRARERQQSQPGARAPQGGGQGQPGGEGGEPGGVAGQGGVPRGGGGGGRLDAEDARQFARELGERRQELEQLRRELEEAGIDTDRLDPIVRGMRGLDIGEPRGLAELGAAIIPGLKEFEYLLRRALQGASAERLMVSGSDAVPAEYRALVEEYYRALARSRRER